MQLTKIKWFQLWELRQAADKNLRLLTRFRYRSESIHKDWEDAVDFYWETVEKEQAALEAYRQASHA